MKKNKVSRRVCTAGIDVYETYLFRLGALYAEIPPPPLPSSGMGFLVVFPFVAQVLFYFFGVFTLSF
jgi:hypothetical protein